MRSDDGFTLIELLVSLVVGLLALIAIWQTFQVQHRTFNAQEQVVGLQQNLRAAVYILSREIRMVGYDPTNSNRFGFEVSDGTGNGRTCDAANIYFTTDVSDEDGQVSATSDEQVAFRIYRDPAAPATDPFTLQKYSTGAVSWIAVADNIDALDFIYLDEDGNELTPAAANIRSIRSVQVTLVGRSARRVQGVKSNKDLDITHPDGVTVRPIFGATGDNHIRRLLSARVKCRNVTRF